MTFENKMNFKRINAPINLIALNGTPVNFTLEAPLNHCFIVI